MTHRGDLARETGPCPIATAPRRRRLPCHATIRRCLPLSLLLVACHVGGCSRKVVGCEQFVQRYIQCTNASPEKKPSQLKRCIAQLAHPDMGRYQEAMFQCVKPGECAPFRRCIEAQKRHAQLAATQGQLQRKLSNLRVMDGKNLPLHTARACPRDRTANRLRVEKDSTSRTLAKEYYEFCLAGLPRWLRQLRDGQAQGGFSGVCGSQSSFLVRAGASAEQKNAIQSACDELRVAGAVRVVKKNGANFLKAGRLPARCHVRWIQPLLARKDDDARKLARRFAAVCYTDLATRIMRQVLPTNGLKLDGKTCRNLKPLLLGFRKLPFVVGTEQKTLIARVLPACKKVTPTKL